MKFTKVQIQEIENYLDGSEKLSELDEMVEVTMDHLVDEGIVDLSEDDDGDMYMNYKNLLYDFIEDKLSKD